jgi:hypothetical protein
MKRRLYLLLSVLLLVAAFGLVWCLLWRGSASGWQTVTLPNGERYRLAGLSYGTNHLHGPIGARLVSRLPLRLRTFAGFRGCHLHRAEDTHSGVLCETAATAAAMKNRLKDSLNRSFIPKRSNHSAQGCESASYPGVGSRV